MILKKILAFLASVAFCSSSLSANDGLKLEKENATSTFYILFGYPFLWQKLTLKPAISNIEKFTIRFSDPTLPQATGVSRGLMDSGAGYWGFGSHLITNKSTLQTILNTFEQLPPSYGVWNLVAYAGKLPPHELSEIIFVDNQNQYAIRGGLLFGFNFNNLTFYAADAFIHQDWATFLYGKMKKISAFLQGDPSAPKTIYALGLPDDDPQGEAITNVFYNEILPYVNAGKVKIFWALASLNWTLKPSSRGKVYAIYEGKVPEGAPYPHTPAGAWAYNEDNFDQTTETGAILPIVNPTEKTIQLANEALEFSVPYGPEAPMLFYKNLEGIPDYVIGVPPDIKAFVNNIQSD